MIGGLSRTSRVKRVNMESSLFLVNDVIFRELWNSKSNYRDSWFAIFNSREHCALTPLTALLWRIRKLIYSNIVRIHVGIFLQKTFLSNNVSTLNGPILSNSSKLGINKQNVCYQHRKSKVSLNWRENEHLKASMETFPSSLAVFTL